MLEPIPFAGYMEIDEMNAYELADDYKENWDSFSEFDAHHWIEKAIPVLRQQQAEIEELIKHLEFAGIVVERKA